MEKKICPTCKKIFYKNKNYSKKYWKKQKYCSLKCSKTWFKKGQKPSNFGKPGKIGDESPSYKGGRNINGHGYYRVLIPGTGSYILEHRKVMEKAIGRKLKRNEVVHHINGNKLDNRIENLELMNKSDHDKYETTRRWKDKSKPFRKNLKRK